MITVLAGGDSFIWGSELPDSPHGGSNGFSRITFPALLADNYLCAAYPGIGNTEIASRVREILVWRRPDIVIVCWTWPSRDNALNSDQQIESLRDYLEYYNIPYLFTCADNCIITGKINYENWFMFPAGSGPDQTESPRGFYQWAVENKYPMGKQYHPLEQAHYDAAQLIKGKFYELVTKSLEQNKIRSTI
jgi:hypothetical protein